MEGNIRYEEKEFKWVDMFNVVRERFNYGCDMKKFSDCQEDFELFIKDEIK